MNKEIYWLWYSERLSMTKKMKYDLYKKYEDIEALYNSDTYPYKFLSDKALKDLSDKNIDKYEKIADLYKKNNVKLISVDMEEYPQMLKHLSSPPVLLYCRGKFINLNERVCVSVVGTRHITDYGRNCASNISKELAQNGFVIVSGMAYGIDAVAHRAALDEGMPTVAVIGTGVNLTYPKTNASLMRDIIKTGMVISEYPLNTVADRHHFPERNRIISALSVATLVVEADIKSGSLITANLSNELGRDVYAVPGSIYSVYSKGTNHLIRDGAYLTTCAEDIISNYRFEYADFLVKGMNDKIEHNNNEEDTIIIEEKISPQSDNLINEAENDEEKILILLEKEPFSIDEIHQKTDIPISVLNQKLLLMEISGKIVKLPGNNYRKNISD